MFVLTFRFGVGGSLLFLSRCAVLCFFVFVLRVVDVCVCVCVCVCVLFCVASCILELISWAAARPFSVPSVCPAVQRDVMKLLVTPQHVTAK